MKITCIVSIVLLVFVSSVCLPESSLEGRNLVELEGRSAKVVVDLGGGGIVDFHLLEQNLNPLTWNYPEKGDLEPQSIGHFICFDRLGRSTPQESKNGMPGHGEAAHVEWEILSQPVKINGTISSEMLCELPIAGMQLKRTISLLENEPVIIVKQEITNMNKLGKVYNIVQHSAMAPPFLDESILIDTNATKGFAAGNPFPTFEEPAFYWPKVVHKGEFSNLRLLISQPAPGVANFIFPDDAEYGWITICNPGKELMMGYFWKLSDYPWVRTWRRFEDGKPVALGPEFGTTCLPLPFEQIIAKKEIFGRPVYEYLDTGETVEKSYTAFLARIPVDYKGVADIQFKDGTITLNEHDGDTSRDIVVKIK